MIAGEPFARATEAGAKATGTVEAKTAYTLMYQILKNNEAPAIFPSLLLSATAIGEGLVAYTSPVFWTFFLLTGLTLFVFRRRAGEPPAFRVPLHPFVTLAFCAMCAYMLWSSINYIRFAVELVIQPSDLFTIRETGGGG